LWEDLQQWLDADPRHRAAFVRLRCAWARTDKLRLLRPPDGRVDKDLLSKLIYEED
jgi:ferric-dicitrate binding protein FerR (iron transport regulator)